MRRRIAVGALAVATVTGGLAQPADARSAVAVHVVGQHAHPSRAWEVAHAQWVIWRQLSTARRAKIHHQAAVAAAAVWKHQLQERAAAAARASRARRRAALNPVVVWANQPFSIRVANCESGDGPSDHSSVYRGNPHLRDPNGHYGKWQFDFSTWREVGGTGNPADYSEAFQDALAYKLWKANGWSRWQCAGMVG